MCTQEPGERCARWPPWPRVVAAGIALVMLPAGCGARLPGAGPAATALPGSTMAARTHADLTRYDAGRPPAATPMGIPRCGKLGIRYSHPTPTAADGGIAGAVFTIRNLGGTCRIGGYPSAQLVFVHGMRSPNVKPAAGALRRRLSSTSLPLGRRRTPQLVIPAQGLAQFEVHWTPGTVGRCWGGSAAFRVVDVRLPDIPGVQGPVVPSGLTACKGDDVSTTPVVKHLVARHRGADDEATRSR